MKWPTYLQDQFMYTTIVYNMALEKSCYGCRCKGLGQPFDLIIGDWYAACEGPGAKGSSCAIALTGSGLGRLRGRFPDMEPLDMGEVIARNQPLVHHVEEPKNNQALTRWLLENGTFEGVERFFPKRHGIKKLLVKAGLFERVKRPKGRMA